ncbi:oligosaccharide biosynthesis protein Alg14 like-domain-containing protein [Thelonectria olida]|uniref:UDP-N-acetylglucosamine transferase subunit ALG14 n=1 Tax=Thelonectria olida TaxID=1576542 RepID=A0A9P8WDH0_9HYPO|nr:oligosaccharide biosynthesis protein Alg14 like-domain-containing protein [Thelonectria olida]
MPMAVKSGSGLSVLIGAVAVVSSIGITSVLALPSWRHLILAYLALFIVLVIFITTRHIQVMSRRRAMRVTTPGARRRAIDYCLFVLGSGGHTKEMLMMMDDGYTNFANFHRRYLLSSGDTMSENHLEQYEADLKTLCDGNDQSSGTYDKCVVARARRVHQPLWSTPFTSLLSILDIFPVLLSAPTNKVGNEVRYPTYIFSNGPATGFFVAMAVYLLKMFYIVPENAMRFIYIESWARISTLSLTGKLLYYTGLADIFLVQHTVVAAKYGVGNAGEMVFNSRRPE